MHHIAFFSDLRHQRFPGSFIEWSNVVKRWYLVVIAAVSIVTSHPTSPHSWSRSPSIKRFRPQEGARFHLKCPRLRIVVEGTSHRRVLSLVCEFAHFQIRYLGHCSIDLLYICISQLYNGFRYTSCLGENQVVDAIEAGRGNVCCRYPHPITSFLTSSDRFFRYCRTTRKVRSSLNWAAVMGYVFSDPHEVCYP